MGQLINMMFDVVGPGYDGVLWECSFREMYCEWYGVCDFVVLSAVEVCVAYGGLCQCMWYSLCCCLLFVSYVWVLLL